MVAKIVGADCEATLSGEEGTDCFYRLVKPLDIDPETFIHGRPRAAEHLLEPVSHRCACLVPQTQAVVFQGTPLWSVSRYDGEGAPWASAARQTAAEVEPRYTSSQSAVASEVVSQNRYYQASRGHPILERVLLKGDAEEVARRPIPHSIVDTSRPYTPRPYSRTRWSRRPPRAGARVVRPQSASAPTMQTRLT